MMAHYTELIYPKDETADGWYQGGDKTYPMMLSWTHREICT